MNRLKKLTTLAVVIVIVAANVLNVMSQKPALQGVRVTKARAPISQQSQEPTPYVPDVIINEATIDGAKNPEQIPDQVAYRLFLRFLSNRQTEEEKNRARSYLKLVLSACRICNQKQQLQRAHQSYKAQIDALLTAADEYAQKASVFEDQAKKVRSRCWT